MKHYVMAAVSTQSRHMGLSLLSISIMCVPIVFSLFAEKNSDELYLEQSRVLGRMETLDRISHYFDVTRFWNADLADSAERVSEDLADSALEELANTGSSSLASSSWVELNRELDLLKEYDQADAKYIRENALKTKKSLQRATIAFSEHDRDSATVASATARSAIANTHTRLRVATQRRGEEAARLVRELRANARRGRDWLIIGGSCSVAIVLLLTGVVARRGREAAQLEPVAELDSQPAESSRQPSSNSSAPTPVATISLEQVSQTICAEQACSQAVVALSAQLEASATSGQVLVQGLSEHEAACTQLLEQLTVEGGEGHDREDTSIRGIAKSAQEVTGGLGSVASHTESMVEAISLVSISIQEMKTSVTEVAEHSQQAAEVASRASEIAARTDTTIGTLGQSAVEIGTIIEVISEIAEQTNLLALNASIEAARAGDAGRGFAVVADEVKALAKETAKATGNISANITAIRASTGNAVDAIAEMVAIIEEINGISETITTAVNSQLESSSEIANSTGEAADSAQIINESIRKASMSAQELATEAEAVLTGSTDCVSDPNDLRMAVAQLKSELEASRSSAAQHVQDSRKAATDGDKLTKLSRDLQHCVEALGDA